ncbi:ankyrin repeat domain-containing protein [Endozoicomonas sp. 8E]|uniref:ankyrin repeat domain-containing protein n=1 Tax=Endozoicomonas sp. 8E TaxID=3035692 RepID=UPI002938F7DA|nr:ankyrin repeat domain-containing protein [Endozoicomonas sp. 8E]WOG28494.1 ankyrin repeat domain-containing protein [Endozoicomonas sp. 8E]
MTRPFVVEFQQDAGSSTQSFSIKSDPNTQPHISSGIADTNGDSDFLPVNKRHGLSDYGLKTAFIKSISYATNLLVAYELAHNAALGAKPVSWLPSEAFVLVGWLLKSYWKPDSLLFNPLEKPGVASMMSQGDEPFTITRMMLPGNNQQQNGQGNQQPSSSGQQASGTSSNQPGSYSTSPLSSGSGGGNEGSEQHQHTLGLDCYVDSCHGVCKLRSSTDSKASAEGPLNTGVFPAQFSTQGTDINQTIGPDSVTISSINSEVVCTTPNQGGDANARCHSGSLLHNAVSRGHSNTVQFLLADGADPDAPDHNGHCPLWFAIRDGHAEIVELLLHSGASLYHSGYFDRALLLCWAIRSGPQMTATLLANGVEPSDPRGFIFPLSVAVRSSDLKAIKLLLANGANPNVRDSEGVKVIHEDLQSELGYGYGYYSERVEIVTILLARHFVPFDQLWVPPNVSNKHNKPDLSLLHLAEKNGHIKVANILKNYTPVPYQPASLQCWARASIRSRLVQNRANFWQTLRADSHCLQLPRHLKAFVYRPLSF